MSFRVVSWFKFLESNDGVGSAFDVNRVDKADALAFGGHDHRVRALARAEKADAPQKRAVGDAGRGENDPFAGRQVVGVVNLFRVFDLGGERVGVAGVSQPAFPPGGETLAKMSEAKAALEASAQWLEQQGAPELS